MMKTGFRSDRVRGLAWLALTLLVFCLPESRDDLAAARSKMIRQLQAYGITDSTVLAVMGTVERQRFVPKKYRSQAYADRPLPIGAGQTISQPYVVALMTQELHLKKSDNVLEIGTGSGYQAAILAHIVDSVFTIEIKKKLAQQAGKRLRDMGYSTIQTRCADGYYGWPEHAPFDAIIITCAVNHIPPPLLAQLKNGGRLILPLGSTRYYQTLTRVTKENGKMHSDYLGSVSFVPMTGAAEKVR